LGIIKSFSKPRHNITRLEKEALRTLKKNTDFTILPAGKDNVTIIINTVESKQNSISFLEDPSYRRVDRDLTHSAERTTTPMLKIIISHRRCMQKLRPAGSRHPRNFGLSKINTEGGVL